MIGSPKIGKSEFWSFCNGLYIQTEAGLNHLSVMKVPCRSWEDWEDIYSALIKQKNSGQFTYDTIIIDTIDNFVDYANTRAVEMGTKKFKAAEINTVGDIPNGAGWAWATNLVDSALSQLESLGCCVAYIGHLDRKEVKKPNNVSIHLQTISIGGKTGRNLMAWADHILNVESAMIGNNMKRVVRTRPTASVEAGSRGNMIPDNWIWEDDMKVNWEKFRGLFK